MPDPLRRCAPGIVFSLNQERPEDVLRICSSQLNVRAALTSAWLGAWVVPAALLRLLACGKRGSGYMVE